MKTLGIPLKLAVRSLVSNWGRTFLSLLGITIGTASVVLVLSLGLGVKNYVLSQVESFGTDVIDVEIKAPQTKKDSAENANQMVGGAAITTYKLKDAEAVSRISGVDSWYGGLMSQQVVGYQGKNEQTMIMGVTPGIALVDAQFKIEKGRMYLEDEDRGLKQVVVLGSEVATDFFGSEDPLNKKIKIKGISFEVIGVLKERGSTGFFSFDSMIHLPLETLQKKIMGIDYLQYSMFKLKDPMLMDLKVAEITQVMRDRHQITDPNDDDFSVMPITEAVEMLKTIFAVVNALLLALTSISLVVGGVGIMNVMYVAVTERTAEIGLRKALGAWQSDILRQFLAEAVFIAVLGGLFGVFLGFLGNQLTEKILVRYNIILSFPLSPSAVALSLLSSLLIGILFGSRPAYKASLLTPMEALNKR
jgi:putative ABC transport system permease protein